MIIDFNLAHSAELLKHVLEMNYNHSLVITHFSDDSCFILGFLTNLEYASCIAILQVSFSLMLILAVFILKKIKFSQVFSVEQNLNRYRIFNSSFTYGPGICIFIGSIVLPVMCFKRLFPEWNSEQEVVIIDLFSFRNNLFSICLAKP